MALYEYNPGRVYVSFAGVDLVGWPDGDFVTVEFADDRFKLEVGAGGDATRVLSLNYTGTATVRLQAGSPSNDRLDALAVLDEADGSGRGPFMIKDDNGRTLVMSPEAFIMKRPPLAYGADAPSREWQIGLTDLNVVVGGSVF